MMPTYDLTGQRFGNLVAMRRSQQRLTKSGGARWLCVCDCGKKRNVGSHVLRYGITKSCGCSKRKLRHDLTGQRFAHWLVVKRSTKRTTSGHPLWRCVCDCGKKRLIWGHELRHGSSKSCGCRTGVIVPEWARRNSPTRNSWRCMITRCTNDKSEDWAYYGGRGITVCVRWLGDYGLLNFCLDMGRRKEGFTLDRINPNGNYEPSNCRWADATTQRMNQRRVLEKADDELAAAAGFGS